MRRARVIDQVQKIICVASVGQSHAAGAGDKRHLKRAGNFLDAFCFLMQDDERLHQSLFALREKFVARITCERREARTDSIRPCKQIFKMSPEIGRRHRFVAKSGGAKIDVGCGGHGEAFDNEKEPHSTVSPFKGALKRG